MAGVQVSRLSRIETGRVQPTETEIGRILATFGPRGRANYTVALKFLDSVCAESRCAAPPTPPANKP